MADGFTASVDSSALIGMLDRLAQSGDFVTRRVGMETAERIVREADSRVRRATGVTESGIHWELSRDGKGYVVMAYRAGVQAPVDRYLEEGTRFMYARPFFFASVELEGEGHLRRLQDAMQEWLDEVGR